jgi:hypothetical protein
MLLFLHDWFFDVFFLLLSNCTWLPDRNSIYYLLRDPDPEPLPIEPLAITIYDLP